MQTRDELRGMAVAAFAVVAFGMAALVAAGSGATAQNLGPITVRQQIYRSFSAATKPVLAMLKGSIPFDAATVDAAFATYVEGAEALKTLFPDDAKSGHDTEAALDIWDNRPDFDARLARFAAEAREARTVVTDQASLAATMPRVLVQCVGCHRLYRVHS